MTQTAEVQARPIAHATAQATERATGLTLLALAAAVIGIALLLWAGTWFALYGANDIVAGSRLAAVGRVMGLIMVVVGVLAFVLAHGLWELRSWAWPLGVAVVIAALALTVLSAGRGSPMAHSLSLALEVATLWYLLTPRIHDAFRAEGAATPD
jgi:hypothetical protein